MDINCDLGEGEALTRTRALLRCVTSASIACGGHAGDVRSMRSCLQLCREMGVKAGAHPGYLDRENFGRAHHDLTVDEFRLLLSQQLGAFLLVAKNEGVPMAHVKLHGALYHAVENDEHLAKAYVAHLQEYHPKTRIIALAGGLIVRTARKMGRKAWGEIFADRRYLPSGQLMPRDNPQAVIENVAEVRERMVELQRQRALDAETICVHSDSPNALRIARLLKTIFA